METIKKFGPAAVCAVAAIEASKLVGVTGPVKQIGLAILAAFGGLYVASKI